MISSSVGLMLMSPCTTASALSRGKLEACRGKVVSVCIDSIHEHGWVKQQGLPLAQRYWESVDSAESQKQAAGQDWANGKIPSLCRYRAVIKINVVKRNGQIMILSMYGRNLTSACRKIKTPITSLNLGSSLVIWSIQVFSSIHLFSAKNIQIYLRMQSSTTIPHNPD